MSNYRGEKEGLSLFVLNRNPSTQEKKEAIKQV